MNKRFCLSVAMMMAKIHGVSGLEIADFFDTTITQGSDYQSLRYDIEKKEAACLEQMSQKQDDEQALKTDLGAFYNAVVEYKNAVVKLADDQQENSRNFPVIVATCVGFLTGSVFTYVAQLLQDNNSN